jgi:hypothetical protein
MLSCICCARGAARRLTAKYASSDESVATRAMPPSADLHLLPHAKTHHSFWASNATAVHNSPLFAFGDIIDNSREAAATTLDIAAEQGPAGEWRVVVTDDGLGMDERGLHAALSLAYTQKDAAATGRHYGMGMTSALPRLCKQALILTCKRDDGHWTAGLLSTTFSKELEDEVGEEVEALIPMCTWNARKRTVLKERTTTAPLDGTRRRASLRHMLQHTQVGDEAALLAEFDRAYRGPPTDSIAARSSVMMPRVLLTASDRVLTWQKSARTARGSSCSAWTPSWRWPTTRPTFASLASRSAWVCRGSSHGAALPSHVAQRPCAYRASSAPAAASLQRAVRPSPARGVAAFLL